MEWRSKYLVSGAQLTSQKEVKVLKAIEMLKKYPKATHNYWAVMFCGLGPIKNDYGIKWAGFVIFRMQEREQIFYHLIILTRCLWGTHLEGDRFRPMLDCVKYYLAHYQSALDQ